MSSAELLRSPNSFEKNLNSYTKPFQVKSVFPRLLGNILLLSPSFTGHMIMFTSIVPNEVDIFLPPEMPLVILSYCCLPVGCLFLTSDLSVCRLVGWNGSPRLFLYSKKNLFCCCKVLNVQYCLHYVQTPHSLWSFWPNVFVCVGTLKDSTFLL